MRIISFICDGCHHGPEGVRKIKSYKIYTSKELDPSKIYDFCAECWNKHRQDNPECEFEEIK